MPSHDAATLYDDTMSQRGLRLTAQRRQVYDVLLAKRDHPTAIDVFLRVKEHMPSISLATVYNCLETLTECGLARHISIDRKPSRYCPNLEDHGHFFCEGCGTVIDVPLRKQRHDAWELPPDAVLSQREVSLRGFCPGCVKQQAKRKSKS